MLRSPRTSAHFPAIRAGAKRSATYACPAINRARDFVRMVECPLHARRKVFPDPGIVLELEIRGYGRHYCEPPGTNGFDETIV